MSESASKKARVCDAMLLAVGTYSEEQGHVKGPLGQGLYTLRADAEGRLQTSGAAPLFLRSPTYLVRHPSLSVFYACQETMSWEDMKGEAGAVASVTFDVDSGCMTILNQVPLPGGAHCHVDTDGDFLFVASYMGKAGVGLVHMLPLAADGSLQAPCDTASFTTASKEAGDAARGGVDAGRQNTSHPHMACLHQTAESTSVLVPDLGADTLYRLTVDKALRKFLPAGEAKLAVGSGPRHCVVDANANVAYVISELTSTIDVVDLASMTSKQRISTLPKDVDLSHNAFFHSTIRQSECAAIKLSPDGRFLFGSNRGHDSIVVCSVADGRLEVCDIVKTGGMTPRDFFVGPDGSYVLAMNQDSGNIVRLALDKSGKLSLPKDGEDTYQLPAAVAMIALN